MADKFNDSKELRREPPKETVRGVIKNINGETLILQKRNREKWEIPGGKTDGKIKEELAREVFEETNLKIKPQDFSEMGSFTYDILMPDQGIIASRLVHQLTAKIDTDGSEVRVGKHDEDNHADFKWVDDAELEKLRREGKMLGNSMYVDGNFPEQN